VRAQDILETLQHGDLLAAADLYTLADTIPKAERASFFAHQFDTTAKHVPPICTDIASLDLTVWLTTNFDNNLYFALNAYGVERYSNDQHELESALSSLVWKKMLVHLHGRATVHKSLVYSTETYRRMRGLEAYKQLLRHLVLTHSIIALGSVLAIRRFRRRTGASSPLRRGGIQSGMHSSRESPQRRIRSSRPGRISACRRWTASGIEDCALGRSGSEVAESKDIASPLEKPSMGVIAADD
jgi:SIR2-like protein